MTVFGAMVRRTSAPFHVAPRGAIRRVMDSPGLGACRPSRLASSYTRCRSGPPLRGGDGMAPDGHGGPAFRIGKRRRASWPCDAGSWAPS
jgi:hypothetical protein